MPLYTKLTPNKLAVHSANDTDQDGDGLTNLQEQELAERFAPVIYHQTDEPNLPANVDWFLGRTALRFFDRTCGVDDLLVTAPTQSDLHWLAQQSCGADTSFDSYNWRDANKQRTFYLADLTLENRRGPEDTRLWTTYYHAYPNNGKGVTIQYWRFHAYNTGLATSFHVLGKTLEGGFHGGDWEGIQVVLDRDSVPLKAHFLGHTEISELGWNAVEKEGDHAVIYSEKGGHASRTSGDRSGIRQETWTGGITRWPNGTSTASGELVNLGARRAAMNGQLFVYYSGLWGSPSQYSALAQVIPAALHGVKEMVE